MANEVLRNCFFYSFQVTPVMDAVKNTVKDRAKGIWAPIFLEVKTRTTTVRDRGGSLNAVARHRHVLLVQTEFGNHR